MNISRSATVLASSTSVFNWHKNDMAFKRLLPPWMQLHDFSFVGDFNDRKVNIKCSQYGIPMKLCAQHESVIENLQFVDRQLKGPFKSWVHTHSFEPLSDNHIKLTDSIDFELPFSLLSEPIFRQFFNASLNRLLKYRQHVTAADLQLLYNFPLTPQVVAVSGASGLVGAQLISFLEAAGHTVRRMVRSKHRCGPNDLYWEPNQGILDDFSDVTVMIHLAGEPIASLIRWSQAKKQRIYDSRVQSTKALVRQLNTQSHSVHTFICASAIGYYPNSTTSMTETSRVGNDFLSQVVLDWETACDPIRDKIRVCNPRFGTILHPNGGMLKRLYPFMKLGLLGPISNGQQFFSWVSLDDAVRSIYLMMASNDLDGPVNVVNPTPQKQLDWIKDFGNALLRPTFLPLPKFVVTQLMGEMGEQLLLRSSKILPTKLIKKRFNFQCLTMKDFCYLYYQ